MIPITHSTATLLICISSVLVWNVQGSIEDTLKEQTCLKRPPKSVFKPDTHWLESVPHWYYKYGSKLGVYRTSAEILNVTVSEVDDETLQQSGCLVFRVVGNSLIMHGFGRSHSCELVPVSDGAFTCKFENTDLDGSIHFGLTDNASYVFFYTCWDDHLASWGVLTTNAETSTKQDLVKKIFKHAKALGFEEKQFTSLQFDSCKKKKRVRPQFVGTFTGTLPDMPDA